MADQSAGNSTKTRPFWLPDTQGFLAIAIILVVSILAFVLISTDVKMDDKISGAFMTLLGVLTACLKDVFAFFFGSSRGSQEKDGALADIAKMPTVVAPNTPAPPPNP